MLILLVLLLISNGVTAYLLITKHQENVEIVTQNTDLTVEKDNLTRELEDMLAQYDSVQTDNEQYKAEIAEQRAKIEEMLAEAEKHKNDAWTIHKLKKETGTLREIMKSYIVTIDSLNTVNQNLVVAKKQVETQLSTQKEENQELNKTNEQLSEKVKLGSKLRVVDLASSAQRMKSGTVSRETDRAKRVDKIKTCFTIDKNEVSKPGKKWLYLRIITPSGEVLALDQTETYMFTYDGKEGLYTRKEEVLYDNQEVDMCLYWDVTSELSEGKYIVEVYAEDYFMGSTEFTLK
jgi:cell division septum initiation protein DivIVA